MERMFKKKKKRVYRYVQSQKIPWMLEWKMHTYLNYELHSQGLL